MREEEDIIMKRKFFVIGIVFSIVLFNVHPVSAEDSATGQAKENKIYAINMEDAVKIGLQNSISLKQVETEIKLSEFNDSRSRYISRKLENGDKKLEEGSAQLSQAANLLNAGIAISAVTVLDNNGNTVTIQPGHSLSEYNISDATKTQVKTGMQNYLSDKKNDLVSGDLQLISSLQDVNESLSGKLNMATTEALNLEGTRDLMTAMSKISLEITKASYDIYKNQVAMLIQKCYYDVLKAQKMLDVKKKSVERAEKQYQFAKDGFEEGMKAKDDMLLAGIYLKGTQIELQKAQGDLNTAMIELKKNLNVPMDAEVVMTDVLAQEVEGFVLEEDLVRGMKNRLEIKKALGEKIVNDLNLESVKKDYDSITFKYKEAEIVKEKTDINFEKIKTDVEASIRQSYETVKSTGEMLKMTADMVVQAKESLEIAEYKYKEGFGTDSSLLKKLDLEASAGTIVEALAAEENLSQVEEKVVEIMYGYNLAKMKYFNDTGKFIY